MFRAGITNDPARSPQTFQSDPAAIAKLTGIRPALWYGRTVGGSSTHFTANYWRFHEIGFVERSRLGPMAGTRFEDWPITYAELEPYRRSPRQSLRGFSHARERASRGPDDSP